jgi:tRNA dimethylallyltransferase
MDPGNLRRAVRALEVHQLTGRAFSDWRRAWDAWDSVYPSLQVVGIAVDRGALSRRLDVRVDTMIEAGWLEECRALEGAELSPTARQAIGYAELLDHLSGSLPIDDAVERIKTRTRRYATRQDRWFRADPRVQWVSADQAPDLVRSLCTS